MMALLTLAVVVAMTADRRNAGKDHYSSKPCEVAVYLGQSQLVVFNRMISILLLS